jgi:hypothetical protein
VSRLTLVALGILTGSGWAMAALLYFHFTPADAPAQRLLAALIEGINR